jgi:Fic family protein
MYFKEKKIKGRKYKYAVKSVRLPDGKVVSIERLYKREPKEEMFKFFDEREREANYRYALKKFGTDHIFSEEELKKAEAIRLDYKKIMKKLPKTNIKDLFDRFTANFTYESNAIEGNSLTLKDVAMVMFENVSLKGKDLREIYETRNSRKVVGLIFANKFSISHEGIIRMHALLVKDTNIPTGYKKVPNFIAGRENIKITPPEKVYEDMNQLIEWYNLSKDKIHPLKLAAMFHGKFEQIHPFEDGNGRVGRFLINVILIKAGYPPLIIRTSQRVSYLNALEDFDSKHKDSIERFILERFRETYKKFFEIYVKYIH